MPIGFAEDPGIAIDLEATERERDSARDSVSEERRLVQRHRPV